MVMLPSVGFEFADAIHYIALEGFDDWRSRGVGLFKPGERAAKMPKFIKDMAWLKRWKLLR